MKVIGLTEIAVIAGSLVWLPAYSCAAVTYTLTDLGDLPGGDNTSRAYAINNHGQVVGQGNVGLFGTVHAFLWDATNGMQDLGLPPTPGASWSIGTGINDVGQVVGYNDADLAGGSTTLHAFKWDATNGIQDLGQGVANAINSMGQIAGKQGAHAALWSYSGTVQDLGALPGNNVSIGNGISDLGVVVGFSESAPDRAFRWSPGDGLQDLNALTGGFAGMPFPNDVNDLGQVVGRHENVNVGLGSGMGHAFLWSESEGVVNLGISSEERSEAFAINNLGQVVGIQKLPNLRGHAFIWDSQNGMFDLHDLVDASGTDWELEYAYDINEHGQIVGSGLGPNGYHAFLLTPVPEPSTITLGALGLLGLFAFSWRRMR